MLKSVGFVGGKFLPFHNGHMYLILEASGLVDKLYVVLSSSKNRDEELCRRDGMKYVPAEVRLSWLGAAFSNIENIEIIHVEDDQLEDNYDWAEGSRMITQSIPEQITHIFSSEQSYDRIFKKYYPNAEHVIIDHQRNTVDISATKIRQNIYDNWDKLPDYVRSYFVKKVVVVGTESVGKSTLVAKLAKFFNTNFVHEVGRDYCVKYKNQLTVKMFDSIAMEHFLLQEKLAMSSNKILLVDSEAIITHYYLDMYFQASSKLIETLIGLQHFDLWLYLEPDVEWVADNLRFAGKDEERIQNNEKLKQMFLEKGVEYISISGDYSNRFKTACKEIERVLGRIN